MWKKHISEVNYTEKFGELTEEKIDSILTNFSNLEIEDKLDILLYILDSPKNDFQLVRKHALANDDIRYHLLLAKSGNNFADSIITTDKLIEKSKWTSMNIVPIQCPSKRASPKKNEIILEEINSQTIDKKIEICKSFILYNKLDLFSMEINKEISNFFTSNQEMVKITNAIIDCVKKNNSFNCDYQIINKIKAIERQEKMDEFLKEYNNERLLDLLSEL
jgi:hypothetical protein